MRVLLLVAVCLASAACAVQAAVMAVDLGSELMKVAIVKPSKLQIAVDETNKRKVPHIIAFDDDERHFGNGATSQVTRKPKNTYVLALTLLGQSVDGPAVAALREMGLPYEFVALEGRGSAVGIRHDEHTVLAPEELVAMTLQHARRIAEADAQQPIHDAIITVPPFFAQVQRRALLAAAELAGLHVLALVHENTAAAVQYGVDRTYANASEPHHVAVFYNMGASATKVSVVEYFGVNATGPGSRGKVVGQMVVRAAAFDETLGGRAFDARLVKHFVGLFAAQLAKAGDRSTNLTAQPRVMAKLRELASRTKYVLSANPETPAVVASLFNDLDFQTHVTRDQFAALSADLLDRVAGPLQRALADAGIEPARVDKLIVLGGCTRIPAVQNAIKTFMKRDTLDMNVDADEAMALGAAFIAANLSTGFRVRPFGLTEVTSWPVGVRVQGLEPGSPLPADPAAAAASAPAADKDEDAPPASSSSSDDAAPAKDKGFSKRATLFARYSPLHKRKTVSFAHTGALRVSLHYDATAPPSLPAHVAPLIAQYTVQPPDPALLPPMPPAAAAGTDPSAAAAAAQPDSGPVTAPRVALKFSLNGSALVELERAEVTWDEHVRVAVPKPKPAPPPAPAAAASADANATNATDAANANATATDSTASTTPAADGATEGSSSSSSETPAAQEAPADSADPTAAAPTPDAATAASSSSSSGGGEPEVEYRVETRTRRLPLAVDELPDTDPAMAWPVSAAQLARSRALLARLTRADQRRHAVAAARNALESFVYDTRAALADEAVVAVSTDAQRDELTAALAAAEEWLYTRDGSSAGTTGDETGEPGAEFTGKQRELAALWAPVKERRDESVARPKAVNVTRSLLNSTRALMAKFAEERPWVNASERADVLAVADELQTWLDQQLAAQAARAQHEAPAFRADDVLERARELAALSKELAARKKPRDPPKKKLDANATAAANGTAANATDEAAPAAENATDATDPAAGAGTEAGAQAGAGAEAGAGAGAGDISSEPSPAAAADSSSSATDSPSSPPPPPPPHEESGADAPAPADSSTEHESSSSSSSEPGPEAAAAGESEQSGAASADEEVPPPPPPPKITTPKKKAPAIKKPAAGSAKSKPSPKSKAKPGAGSAKKKPQPPPQPTSTWADKPKPKAPNSKTAPKPEKPKSGSSSSSSGGGAKPQAGSSKASAGKGKAGSSSGSSSSSGSGSTGKPTAGATDKTEL